ncbi:SAM-dependent methyltransferase [Lichenibacterium dinghuense]|uniref:SAM-dependent methyltransferase n=1 Tax=Lichenibacterium dinghuense TaxID=2895977 RepID=UPI001F413D86|nr:SAM-dependent methyltransferase [Lichenibacterium sp. 6Y81]
MRQDTLGRGHFEALYAARPDPWRLATSDYERAKYAATLAALPRPRYARGFEVGCALGILTAELGRRCDDLLAVEPVEAALRQAAARLADQPHVRLAPLFVPGEWPGGSFDLIVLSEVVDYLGADDVVALAGRVVGSLEPGGDVVLVHWVGKKRGAPSGDEASDRFVAAAGGAAAVLRAERNADYRLDVLRRR